MNSLKTYFKKFFKAYLSPSLIVSEQLDENIYDIINKLFRAQKINIYYIKNNKKNESKNLTKEINRLNQDLETSLKKNDRRYKFLSNKNGIITWSHPDDPNDKNKYIIYVLQNDGSYKVRSRKGVNAYIIDKDVFIDIKSGLQEFYSAQSKIELDPNENVKILFKESRKRFDDYFSDRKITITRPFFLKEDQEKFISDLKSSNTQVKKDAVNELLLIAKENENCFVPTYKNVPYYDKEGNIIFGFDDDREDERYYGESGSKYSIAFKMNANNPNKIDVIKSEKTQDCYILAINKSDPSNPMFELLNIKTDIKDYSIITSNDQLPKIINYDLKKQKEGDKSYPSLIDCKRLCAIIRTGTGNPGIYGINIYRKIQNFLRNIEAYMLLKDYTEEQISSIISSLNIVMNFREGYNLLKVFLNDKATNDFLRKIEDIIITQKHFNSEELSKSFSETIKNIATMQSFESSKESTITKQDKIQPKWPDLIKYDKSKYDLLLSFSDSNCQDEDWKAYSGEVFIFCQKNKEFNLKDKKLSHSFIVEIERSENKEIKSIRAKLGKENEKSNVDSYLEFRDEKLKLLNNNIEFNRDSSFFKLSSASEYVCETCLKNYEIHNQQILLDTISKRKGKSF